MKNWASKSTVVVPVGIFVLFPDCCTHFQNLNQSYWSIILPQLNAVCILSPWLSKTTLKCPPRVCSVNKHRHKLENTRTIPFCIDTTVIQWSCELLLLHVWLFNSINVSSTMPADSQQWQWFILNHTNQLTEELQTGWPDSLTVTIHRSV